jgi:hypothetical protein
VPPIAALGTWAHVVSLVIGSSVAPNASFNGAVSGATLTALSITGTIAIGQTLMGTGVPDGIKIVSGSGNTWTISTALAAPISSEPMMSVAPSLASIAVGVAHVPVLAAANITVNLV